MARIRIVEAPPGEPTALDVELAAAMAENTADTAAVAALEAELRDVVAAGDYAAAAELQAQLEPARQRAAICGGRVAGLRAAAERLAEQRRADEALITRERAREQALQDQAAAEFDRASAQAEAEQRYAECAAGLDAIRASFRAAVAAEQAAHAAQLRLDAVGEVLTGVPATRRGSAHAGDRFRGQSELWHLILQGS